MEIIACKQNIQIKMIDLKEANRDSNKTLTNFNISESQCSEQRANWREHKEIGLIQCLMSQQSNQVQRLKSQIRLLVSKNQYLKKDNQLLQNQIVYLQQQMDRRKKDQSIERVQRQLNDLADSIEAKMKIKLCQLQQRQKSISKKIQQLSKILNRQISSKDNIYLQAKSGQSQKLFDLQIENTKLKIRISQLQRNIALLNNQYLQSFQWKPYLIPQFKTKARKVHLKLDLRKLTKQSTQPNSQLFDY